MFFFLSKKFLSGILRAFSSLFFSWFLLLACFLILMNWIEPRFPAAVRSLMLFFSTGLALIVFRYFQFFTATLAGQMILALFLFFETMFYRPFIFSHFVFFPLLTCFIVALSIFLSWKKKGDFWKKGVALLVFFYGTVPFLIVLSMFMAYRGTHHCDKIGEDPRVHILFSFCEPQWKEIIKDRVNFTDEVVEENAQARTIFISSNGQKYFLGTGLEDDAHNRLLILLDRSTRKVE